MKSPPFPKGAGGFHTKYLRRTETPIKNIGKVLYRSCLTHGKNKKNFEVFTAEEFIAAITRHIPEKYFQRVRYY
jgi:hypothetical protein